MDPDDASSWLLLPSHGDILRDAVEASPEEESIDRQGTAPRSRDTSEQSRCLNRECCSHRHTHAHNE